MNVKEVTLELGNYYVRPYEKVVLDFGAGRQEVACVAVLSVGDVMREIVMSVRAEVNEQDEVRFNWRICDPGKNEPWAEGVSSTRILAKQAAHEALPKAITAHLEFYVQQTKKVDVGLDAFRKTVEAIRSAEDAKYVKRASPGVNEDLGKRR